MEDALNPELNEVIINGNNIVEEVMNNTKAEKNVVTPLVDNIVDINNIAPPSYSEIDTSQPLQLDENINSQSLDSLLSEDEKEEITLQNENINKNVEPVKEEVLKNSTFDKPKTNSNKTRTVGRFQIDELDNIDLEVDELPNIDLQEMSNKQREVQTTSIQPKKKFTFFTDAPNL